jgi:antitoxin CptB
VTRAVALSRRMQWRCRRGIRELDLVFGRFMEQGFADFSEEELASFEHLLDQNDLDIYDWLMGRSEPPSAELALWIGRLQPCKP